ncbi:MAG: 50S ribosomal protein L10 [Patescibacteria group bacterium]
MTSTKKIEQVDKLQEIITQSPNFALIGFGNIPHQNLEELRKSVRKLSAKIKVVKNTIFSKSLAKLAVKNKKYDEARKQSESLKDKTAFLSLDKDYSGALKAILDFSKTNENISFKFGFIDGELYQSDKLSKIAALPSSDQLISKLIYMFKYPSSRFYSTLQAPISRIINVLKSEKLTSSNTEGVSNNG